MTPATMRYDLDGESYELNMIDTPGHVDFSYEVSRALRAVEGTVLLVDATQGIEAQTLSVLSIAKELDLTIVPAVTKIDARHAEIERVVKEVAELVSVPKDEVVRVSGKEGTGVDNLLARIISDISPPTGDPEAPTKGLVFDFDYSSHRGVVAYSRIFSGELSDDESLTLLAADRDFSAAEVGIFSPDMKPVDTVDCGSVGYVVTGVKEPGVVKIGDTLASSDEGVDPLAGYDPPQPVVWASIFPEDQDKFGQLQNALERLLLTDSSLKFEREKAVGLGQGFRCGFLGRLHMEVTVERLRRDFDIELITTSPSVAYHVETEDGETKTVRTPARFPHYGDIASVEEPWVNVTIRTPGDYISDIMTIVYDYEGEVMETISDEASDQLTVTADLPLRAMMTGFFTSLKQSSSGFASLSYDIGEYRPADVVKLDVLVAKEEVPALSQVVSRRQLDTRAREVVEKLHELLPQQVVSVRIQARAEGRIIAAETLAATRKDVTEGLYGGDYSRKKKKLKAQREGKKRLKDEVNVQIPSDVYVEMMREGN